MPRKKAMIDHFGGRAKVPAYQHIADRGERNRFNGFYLTDSEFDRVIARWVDTVGPTVANSTVKMFLYMLATGRLILADKNFSLQHEAQAEAATDDAAMALLNLD